MRWTEPLPFRRGSAREPAKASRREPPNSGARTLRSLSVLDSRNPLADGGIRSHGPLLGKLKVVFSARWPIPYSVVLAVTNSS